VASDEFGCDRLRGGQAAQRARDILQYWPVLYARGAVGYQAERNDELDHDGDFPSAMAYAALQQSNANPIPASERRGRLLGGPAYKQVPNGHRIGRD
jgi:hypothetical protein